MSVHILATAPPAPTAGLLSSLTVRTYLETTHDGAVFRALMLTCPTPSLGDVDPREVKWRMRGVAASAGALPYNSRSPAPRVGARLVSCGPHAVLGFVDSQYGLLVRHPRWVTAATTSTDILLVIGMAALSPTASPAEIDEYREHLAETGDMHVAMVSVGSPRDVRASLTEVQKTGGGSE